VRARTPDVTKRVSHMPTTGRGAHRRPPDHTRTRRTLTVLLALVATGGTAWLALSAGARDRTDSAPLPAAAEVGASAARADTAALQGCKKVVTLARGAVKAATPAYSHWANHVRAQLDYDAGAATIEQTRARWAATKATADADIADFRTALTAFQAARGECAEATGVPADQADVLTSCRSELRAASTAVTAAGGVVDDWAAHVAMMKGKEHTDPAQYGRMWRDMVNAAPDNLGRFASASLNLMDYVECPRPT
jgi:hypothetical protein